MIPVKLEKDDGSPLTLLCLGAHSDDIEIGCGGAIIKILDARPDTRIHWIVFSSTRDRAEEARRSAALFLSGAQDGGNVVVKEFRDSFFPYIGAEIKTYFEDLKQAVNPDLIFTHCRHDLHQDHRLLSELTWNTYRNHLILEYEIIKYDGDLRSPGVFVQLSANQAQRKVDHIMQVFKSQGHRAWFSEDAFFGIMRIRGLESNAPEKYAEGFYCRKMVL